MEGGSTLERIDTPHGRFYVDGNEWFPSVTTMLASIPKPKHIREWEERISESEREKIKKKATGQGTEVHAVLEKYLAGTSISLNDLMPNVATLARGILEECRKIDIVYCSERFLCSKVHKFAGTVDFAGLVGGENEVWDFKTGRYGGFGVDAPLAYRVQLAMYALALEENTTLKFDLGRVVLASTYDGLKVYPVELAKYKKMAKALAIDYHRNNNDKIIAAQEWYRSSRSN